MDAGTVGMEEFVSKGSQRLDAHLAANTTLQTTDSSAIEQDMRCKCSTSWYLKGTYPMLVWNSCFCGILPCFLRCTFSSRGKARSKRPSKLMHA